MFLESPSKPHRGLESQVASAAENDLSQDPIEMSGVETVGMPSQRSHEQVFQILNESLGWGASEPVLQGVNVTFRRASLNVITGPVASGKSTLLKTLLGEIPLIQGSMCSPSSRYAYCDQTTWLLNDTIRKNILGFSNLDPDWYAVVIHATALDEDIGSMLLWDQTLVGSNAITLSGGQKQRVVSVLWGQRLYLCLPY
jgi:ABC-type bacteriocin/lantibiotic exporter with double-glycine peptidase domain